MTVTAMTEEAFRENAEAVVKGIDLNNIPAALLVTAGNTVQLEPPAGGIAVWRRSATIAHLATAIPQRDDMYRLRPLAALYRLAPGMFVAAERDTAGQAFALIAEQCRRQAEEEGVMFARVADGSPIRTAAVAWEKFARLLPRMGRAKPPRPRPPECSSRGWRQTPAPSPSRRAVRHLLRPRHPSLPYVRVILKHFPPRTWISENFRSSEL